MASNHLQRAFTVEAPNQSWVTDITYVRTHDGSLYLAVVVDLWSRIVVGWSMGQHVDTRLVRDSLTMAVWLRRPRQPVLIHSCSMTSSFSTTERSATQPLLASRRYSSSVAISRGSPASR